MPEKEQPFRTTLRSPESTSLPENTGNSVPGDEGDWSVDEIEAAYQQALSLLDELGGPEEGDATKEGVEGEFSGGNVERVGHHQSFDGSAVPAGADADRMTSGGDKPGRIKNKGEGGNSGRTAATPKSIIEAILFVGGEPITAKKLAHVLGGRFTTESVEKIIEDVNQQFAEENRPYEVRLVEGGYTLSLRGEFESIRLRAYGIGPREVKLSQEALEVLAVVAYRQPVTESEVAAAGRTNAGPVLRQLARRELISGERKEKGGELTYRTTGRFLEAFGLGSLHDLPYPEDFQYR